MQVQIVEALRAAIVVVDRDRVIKTTNPAADEILGASARDVGSSIDDTSLLRRFPALARAIAEVAEGGARGRSKASGSRVSPSAWSTCS